MAWISTISLQSALISTISLQSALISTISIPAPSSTGQSGPTAGTVNATIHGRFGASTARRRSARSNLASARSTSAHSASPAVQRASFRGQVQRVGVRNASARDCATCRSAVHFSCWLPLLRIPVLLLSRVASESANCCAGEAYCFMGFSGMATGRATVKQIVVQGKRTGLRSPWIATGMMTIAKLWSGISGKCTNV